MEKKALEIIQDAIDKDFEILFLESVRLQKITENIKKKLSEIKNLKSLTISNCKLESLENLPFLENLDELNLSDNNLKDEELKHLGHFKNIKYLFLSGNKIKNVDSFNFLKDFTNLKFLDVFGCPFTEEDESYRTKIFELCPSLEIIDEKNKNGDDVSYVKSNDSEEEYDEDDYEDEFEDEDDFIENEGDEDDDEECDEDDEEEEKKPEKKQKKN